MFAGIVIQNGRSSFPHELEDYWRRTFAVFDGRYRYSLQKDARSFLFSRQALGHSGPPDQDSLLHCRKTGLQVAIWGRLDNRKDLISALPGATCKSSNAELVLGAWLKWSREMPKKLIGDFALAIIDPREKQLFLARDPMGVKPLYYRIQGDMIAFASTASALKIPGMPATPDRGWVARYLWMNLSNDPVRTAYIEIFKLPGGSFLSARNGEEPTIGKWHDWDNDQAQADHRNDKWVTEYCEVLDQSVADRIAGEGLLGIESTGGIDSSAILASAALNFENPDDHIHAFGNALNEQEPELIRLGNDACGISHSHLTTERRPVSDAVMNGSIAAIGYPEENGTGSSHALFYEQASKQNINVLLSGFGGDEIVSNPASLVRRELAHSRRVGTLLNSFQGNIVERTLRMSKFLATSRDPTRTSVVQNKIWQERWLQCLLRDEIIEEFEIESSYFSTVRNDVDYMGTNDIILNDYLSNMGMSTRLENCTLIAALWGIEYRWPLLDARLIQQYLSTPAIEKLGPRNVGRYLHRRAIDARLPAQIVWKQSKSMGPGLPLRQHEFLPAEWRPGGRLREGLPKELLEFVDPHKLAKGIALIERTPGQVNQQKMGLRSGLVALRWLSAWVDSEGFRVEQNP